MARKYNGNTPTLYELVFMGAIKQAGGEFVDMPTIRLRVGRHGIETTETSIYSVMKRFEKSGYVFTTEQRYRAKGEPFVFFTMTDEGRTWYEHWSAQIKGML